jgi:pyruvate dehydrogenase E1 component alpha subunit
MGTSVERASSIKDLYKKGESFGIAGKQVNGMDFFEVYEAVKEASDFIRKNKTPFLLELKTYRYRGHSMSDPAKYRAKDEVEDYKKHHDPIISLKEYILKNNENVEEDLKNVDKEVKEIVKESADYAQNSDEPSASELYADVYK